METAEEEMKSTYKSRMLRLQLLENLIKEKKKIPRDEVLKFGMNRWVMSRMIVERYVGDLLTRGTVNQITENDVDYLVYAGTEGA